jgi:hypothetical protein
MTDIENMRLACRKFRKVQFVDEIYCMQKWHKHHLVVNVKFFFPLPVLGCELRASCLLGKNYFLKAANRQGMDKTV